jgi:hypothetical protein
METVGLRRSATDTQWLSHEQNVQSCLYRLMHNDLLLDLLAMGTRIVPGADQILSTKCRVVAQQVSPARTELTGLHQNPDRNARPHDTGLTAAKHCWLCDSIVLLLSIEIM